MKITTERGITVIIAEDGKVFRRRETQDMFGEKIYLGYSHYIGGVKLDEPHKDVPEDFEEVKPMEEEPKPEEKTPEKEKQEPKPKSSNKKTPKKSTTKKTEKKEEKKEEKEEEKPKEKKPKKEKKTFEPVHKKDRHEGLDDFQMYENLLNKKTKRKSTKSAKKEAPKTEEKKPEENIEVAKAE